MKTETYQELHHFVKHVLTLPCENLRIDFDAPSKEQDFSIVMLTDRNEDGNVYKEPVVSLRITTDSVDFWNNLTQNGGKYPITMPHLGLFENLLAKFEEANEYNVSVFLKEMSDTLL